MKTPELTTKHLQIQKASSQIFLAIVIASVVVSFSIVLLNILWSQSQFNIRVQDEKEKARDQLQLNAFNIGELTQDFAALELGDDLIPKQGKKTNSAVILDALPPKYDYPAIASSVQNLTKKSGVVLKSFDGTDTEADAVQSEPIPAPVEIPFSVSISGTYTSINKFIDNLENSIRPFSVQTIRLSGNDDNLLANMEVLTWYQPAVDLSITTRTIQ